MAHRVKWSLHLARFALVIVLGWLGAMRFTASNAATIGQTLTDHLLLGGLLGDPNGVWPARVIGALQLATAVLLAVGERWRMGFRIGAAAAAIICTIPLTLMFTNPVWIESMGGFPAIGSGQGIIKYVALAGLGVFVYAEHTGDASWRRRGLGTLVAGLIIPLVWIGGMKFTAVEAAGIEPLLTSSPFFAWMLQVFSLQTTSNIIGSSELVTAGLLATWWYRPSWAQWGAALAGGTFVATLSFLVTLPGWSAAQGFPVLNGAGLFVIKDVGLLAAAAVVWLEAEMVRRGA